MSKNTYGSWKANNGGKSEFSHKAMAPPKKAGKIQGYNAAPLPPQKNKRGSGLAGRASNG